MSFIAWLAIRRSGFVDLIARAIVDRQRIAARVLLRHCIHDFLGLSQLGCGAAVGRERADVEDGQQIQSM
jgi:hypothetical protein